MTDQFPPPGWFPQPAIWPYWPSLKDGFALPQAPSDPWNQPDGNWGGQSGANAGATTSPSNDAWDQTVPVWLRLAMPRIPSGGILGSFPQPNDAPDEGTTPSPGPGRGILAPLERWNPWSSNTGRGILAPLERLNITGDQASLAWLQPTAPFATNTGSLSSSSGNHEQLSSRPPDPTSWDASAPGTPAAGDSPSYQAALAQEARDVAAARFAKERGAAIARLAERRQDDPRGILTRMHDGAQAGVGGGELGISRENIEKYPALEMLQIPARMADTVPRAIGATLGGLTGLGAGLAEYFGLSRADADRLQRDLNVGGTIAALVSGAPRSQAAAPPRVTNGLPPVSRQGEIYANRRGFDDAFRRDIPNQIDRTIEGPRERRPSGERSASGDAYDQHRNINSGPTVPARTHLTDDEAREAINAFRSKEPRKQGELFEEFSKKPEEEERVVAVTKAKPENKFGVNSKWDSYTSRDRKEADQLRERLIRNYPDLSDLANIGWIPNNALYHAETTLLLRLARESGGSLAGRKLVVHVDETMCPSCKELLPYIGLELGNPTITFVNHKGRRLTMQDGKWLK